MSTDLPHRVPTISRDTVSEFLLAVADGYDALAVSVPGEIIDAAADDWVLALGSASANAVPDADSARGVAAGDIVAGRREAGDGCGGGVGGVLG